MQVQYVEKAVFQEIGILDNDVKPSQQEKILSGNAWQTTSSQYSG